MITKDNLRPLLVELGFVHNPIADCYTKEFPEYGDSVMEVDFTNNRLVYPSAIIGRERNTGFDQPENFVVFECVHRLLTKGYRPDNIELEKVWTLGHDQKGGRADICVYDVDGSSMLFILECKTFGPKFKKALKKTKEDGGQIFSYWQQERAVKWIGLYTSDFSNEKIVYDNPLINCSDDANILKLSKKDDSVLVYSNPSISGNAKSLYEVWTNTYMQEFHDDLIFGEDSTAYRIGIQPLRKKNLKDFTPSDKIVNRFEEILRHNNVSDKENAFNRLVALFICKLVDEISKEDEDVVEFQYKIGTDTYESLQDRLQLLHKRGMEEFMKEKIFYVEADYAEKLFKQYTGSQRSEAIKELNNTIKILKFYSNNDFAFKDVHNEDLFFQNGKILVEVVQLFERYRIVYRSKHQFLGDLFEQLLSKGFKQNEGQFFTPMPITRFIWDSLPLKNYIAEHGLPKVIDYSCGAGHFLTEAVAAIDEVRANSDNSWVEKHIWGVEKDYRLSRVSKISMFMNGAGEANIIFGDGLENYPEKEITDGGFDILVANPPYAVTAFKSHLKLKNNNFEILDKISNDGSEIETLFVERAVQLLKSDGIAAIILPSTILSKAIGSYVEARSLIVKNFYIRSIVSLEGKTFGATDTPTVILFLQRFNEPPKQAALAKDVADSILSENNLTNWEDAEIFSEYLAKIGVDEDTYRMMVSKSLSKGELSANEYFKLYVDAFSQTKQSYPKKLNEEEREKAELSRIYELILSVEHEKILVYTLIRNQITTIITAPSDTKKQKEFLGYIWSGRRQNEGIQVITPGGKLYNAEDRFARGTLACKVRNSFSAASTQLSDELECYAKTYVLSDLMEFGLANFHLTIYPNARIAAEIKSKYPLVRLNDKEKFSLSIGRRVLSSEVSEDGLYPVYSANVKEPFGKIDKLLNTDFSKESVLWGIDGDWMVSYVEKGKEFYPTDHCGVLQIMTNEIEPYYIALVLEIVGFSYGFSRSYRASTERIASVQLPLPPLSVQKKIVKECRAIDDQYNTSRMTVEEYRTRISDIFDNLQIVKKSKMGGVILLNQICDYQTDRIDISSIDPMNYISTENMLPNCGGRTFYDGIPAEETVIGYKKGDILVSNIRPYLQKIWLADCDGGCNPDVLVIRVKDTRLFSPKFVYYALRRKMFFDHIMQGKSGVKMPRGNKANNLRFEIPNIGLSEQHEILNHVEKMEVEIQNALSLMNSCETRKRDIVNEYIFER